MSLKHLGPGSVMPPLQKGKLRLYSMVFCPYAQRARLVLAAKNIPFEVVNIKLKVKPEWYLKVNPLGQVPCLHFDDGRTLPESLLVSEYLDDTYPENKLIPTDPYKKAIQRLLIDSVTKVTGPFYKFLFGDSAAGPDILNGLDYYEQKLDNDYFGGDKPTFVDYMIWPWFERLEYLKQYKGLDLNENRHQKLFSYFERMKKVPAVKATIIPAATFDKFFKSYASEEPDYDCGIVQ
uniref:Glutathione S-transferase omega n=1 Tax=Brachionus calyciflorus TaxID=104777 RepID=A0A3G2JS10_9BILA|nr:glutathione S-transferase O1 [Brachionus calyciflorus]